MVETINAVHTYYCCLYLLLSVVSPNNSSSRLGGIRRARGATTTMMAVGGGTEGSTATLETVKRLSDQVRGMITAQSTRHNASSQSAPLSEVFVEQYCCDFYVMLFVDCAGRGGGGRALLMLVLIVAGG